MFLYLNIKYIRNFKGMFNVPSPPLVSSSRSFINNNPLTLHCYIDNSCVQFTKRIYKIYL